ncbi:THUMP domain-containing class I SAM-dependent RNA methyltransferase [Papillibacter cinnamivorans]|uniref:Putative N6-adenine-specific DNA methylase n=1 Tax=Papillibacter cinnamivorans DSM 12816 TaxID=1122930 RepID=A0A1W2A5V6_9FIRM|nr:class I SAM-dependent RNA methyltransferase [Papillibacter cinnamivorans]SMC56119.1 putative N6-adenine-specific DNA methylase [Papillibacter cinnamivorans DSM 12816]
MEFTVPCLFGLEAPAADELKRMGLSNVRAENGRVHFSGEARDIARVNLRLRTGERVLIRMGTFPARSFEELFEGTKALPWEEYIPIHGAFPVKGYSLNSKLHSVPDCQSIIKKAAVERLKGRYKTAWFQETGEIYQIQFSIMKDEASLYIDTTGAGLHKRGYRAVGVAAPLRETLAAGMVNISRYRGKEPFCDPFCGSGTIAIEAALAAINRAPGLTRSFSSQKWGLVPGDVWQQAAQEAKSLEYSGTYDIWGGDIDPDAVRIARDNARKAGVDKLIRFEVSDAAKFTRAEPGGIIISNPPYGERMMDKEAAEMLYRAFGKAALGLLRWKLYLLSSQEHFEQAFGRRADKKRKLYNGMIQCNLFMFGI